MTINRDEVFKKATHVQCQMCQSQTSLQKLMFTVHGEQDVDDLYEIMHCCDDPFLHVVVVSEEEPAFLPDNSDFQDDYWHYGNERWEYILNDDFLEHLESASS